MPVYWSMLFVTIAVGVASYFAPRKRVLADGKYVYKTQYIFALLTFGYVVFFCGLRDSVLDTGAYVGMFEQTSTDWTEIVSTVNTTEIGPGFELIQGLFKTYISEDHYVWLVFLATISCGCLLRVLYKYSVDFPLTAYLFVASTTFTWLINGTRQFLAVSILFAFTDWLIEGKKWRYILVALLASTIHNSAIFLIPICFFVSSSKLWDRKMFLFLILTIIGTYYSASVFGFLDEKLGMDYANTITDGSGSNVMRLFVEAVPLFIAIVGRKCVKKKADKSIILAINMTIVGVCFYFASTFTNGILIGRMPIYFTIYALYLLPWLIKSCFEPKSRKIAWIGCVLLYLVYFYYQMEIAWGGLRYVSKILNLYY